MCWLLGYCFFFYLLTDWRKCVDFWAIYLLISLARLISFSVFFNFWSHPAACGIWVPRPEIEPTPPALEDGALSPGVGLCLYYVFIWLHQVLVTACGISFPDQGLNPGSLHWELRVLTTGPPGKCLKLLGTSSRMPHLRPGIKPGPFTLGAQNPNCWTTKEVPKPILYETRTSMDFSLRALAPAPWRLRADCIPCILSSEIPQSWICITLTAFDVSLFDSHSWIKQEERMAIITLRMTE